LVRIRGPFAHCPTNRAPSFKSLSLPAHLRSLFFPLNHQTVRVHRIKMSEEILEILENDFVVNEVR
jgi:hypothetical protein